MTGMIDKMVTEQELSVAGYLLEELGEEAEGLEFCGWPITMEQAKWIVSDVKERRGIS